MVRHQTQPRDAPVSPLTSPFYPGAEMLWQPMRRMRNIKIIEWAMTNNKNESENENGNENVSFFLPLQLPLSFVSLSLPFCHHKAFSDLAWHILSLLLMLKMANKNVYDARTPTETQVNSRKMCSKKRWILIKKLPKLLYIYTHIYKYVYAQMSGGISVSFTIRQVHYLPFS